MTAAEFIVDSERQYVSAKLPEPILTECAIVNLENLQLKDNGIGIFNGSIGEGVDLSQEQVKKGRIELEDSIKQSRKFRESAKKSAVTTIELLIKEWNPNLPDLQVSVEFMENS